MMAIGNSPNIYGTITKGFHWLTTLLILTTIPVGIIARNMADALLDPANVPDIAKITQTITLFSLHKTLGVSIFIVALARILWALTQPKTGLLNGDKPAEAWLAETVHWLLYSSLILVPLTGWVYHAATTGFAPIWWPFGQDLPFVPKNEVLAGVLSDVHYILQWVMIVAISLHVLGALKHHVIDKDATLRRMLPGHHPGEPTRAQPGHFLPAMTAFAIWLAVLGGADMMGWLSNSGSETSAKAETDTAAAPENKMDGWQVQSGTVQISVKQLGGGITGKFADWSANITYDEIADTQGQHGTVEVQINVGSLTLGSVTKQALATDYFDAQNFPTASFSANLTEIDGVQMAIGTLTIRDQPVPLEIPYELQISGDEAVASGQATLDRRDLGMGKGVAEGTLGFGVVVSFELTAQQAQ